MESWREPRTIVAIIALITSIIALVQPWVVWCWRRYFKRGKVNVFNTGEIEIGFSELGPTMGIHGTMLASERNHFVHKCSLQVTRRKDGATHSFDWQFFRGYQVSSGQPQEMTFELASGFLLAIDQPHRYNMFFIDFEVREELAAKLRSLTESWNEFSNAFKAQPEYNSSDIPESSEIYSKFFETPHSISTFEAIRRMCYWNAGVYTMTMSIRTAFPSSEFSQTWSFELSKDQEDMLLLNGVAIQSHACIGEASWEFAYVKYIEERQ